MQKIYNVCNFSSVALADVLEYNCNPAGEKELSFVVGTFTYCPLHTKMSLKFIQRIHHYRLLKISKNLIQISPCKYGCTAGKNMTLMSFLQRKSFSKLSVKTSNTMGSSGAMFLVDTYPDPGQLVTKTCDWMIWLNPCPFLNAKVCSSICPEQTTENSIQMVSALVLHIFKPL